MAESSNSTKTTDVIEQTNAPEVQIVQAGQSADGKSGVLTVNIPNIQTLTATSEFHGGTEIGLALGQAVVPVSYRIFDVPDKILKVVQREIESAETLMPVDVVMVKRQLVRFNEMTADLVAAIMGGDDLNQLYMYQAVQGASEMATSYCQSMQSFCNDMAVVKQQFASQEAYFMAQNLGSDSRIEVDMELIDAPIEELVNHLNQMTAGEGGYKIVSLLSAIDEVRKILTNETLLKLFGATNTRAMFNQLGFRIEQSDLMFYRQLENMVRMIKPRMQPTGRNKMSGQDILVLVTLAENVQKGLEKMQQMLSGRV